MRFTPLPVVYYSPETRLGFGALVAVNFETPKIPDSVTLTSYAQTYFLYTINKQYDWGTQFRVYTPNNKRIIQGKINYTFFPEYYFGLANEHPEDHKDTIEYKRLAGEFRFYWKWKKNLYFGLATRFNRISNVTGKSGGTLETEKPLGSNGYWVQGFSPAFTIESRDSYVYPRRGFYMEVLYYIYPSWNNKSTNFQNLRLDVRKYFPVTWLSDIDVIAFQFLGNVNTGNTPFKDMADIGGSYTMRGYYSGYYRYNNLYAFQSEFRSRIWKRLGFACWVGAALTPTKWYTFGDHSVKPNAGVGFRIMLNKKDRLNVRIDQGFGKNQNGFYLDIAEAY